MIIPCRAYDFNSWNTVKVSIGGYIYVYRKELRKIKRITQVEMSKMLGLSESAYGLYEACQRQMDIDTFVEACKILDTTPDELLEFNNGR